MGTGWAKSEKNILQFVFYCCSKRQWIDAVTCNQITKQCNCNKLCYQIKKIVIKLHILLKKGYWTPAWCNGLKLCITVLEASLQTYVQSPAVSQPGVTGSPIVLFIWFISPLFNQVGKLRTSSHLQLRLGQDKAKQFDTYNNTELYME